MAAPAERFRVRRAIGTTDQPHGQARYRSPWPPPRWSIGGILIHPTNLKRDHLVDPIWIGRLLAMHGESLGEHGEVGKALEVNSEPTLEA